MSEGATYDVAVIGGGINGCGIARDAQGRGLRVFLAEMGDLGGATSSASTKLIHGGLRYLEFYKFGYVRQALIEREILLASAPHIIRPMRFVVPIGKASRPWPLIRLGLFLYDHLGGRRSLPATRSVDLATDPTGAALKNQHQRAFEYSDCWVDDARLVVLNARDAADRGADIRTRVRCLTARREGGWWRLTLENLRDGKRRAISARALVNATGPWVASALKETAGLRLRTPVRLVKGSHIVVDRLFDHDRAYALQNPDGRVCFAIPFKRDFTLVGSTDEDFAGDPARASISLTETEYLLATLNRYLKRPIGREAIRWSFAGVRPLVDDGTGRAQDATREYVLETNTPPDQAPLVSIIGGKVTTYRKLAETAVETLAGTFPQMRPAWTGSAKLPGGDLPLASFGDWAKTVQRRHGGLDADLVWRLCRAYGSKITDILFGVTSMADLGRHFGAGLTEREVDYLTQREWAESADDILWRRSKLGLRLRAEQRADLDIHLKARMMS